MENMERGMACQLLQLQGSTPVDNCQLACCQTTTELGGP